VKQDAAMSRRVTRGWLDNILAWRWFDQLLCPECAAVAQAERAWNKPVTRA
jgi:hypothetical protein